MLIESPRIRPPDLAAWELQSRYDQHLGRSITKKTQRARDTIQEFAAQGDGYIGISWGKDSTVLAHLSLAQSTLPLVWVRVKKWENPDCELVRDNFLDRWGDHVDYHEIEVESTAPRRWESPTQGTSRTSAGGFQQAAAKFGDRHISGVRADESTTRRLTVARNGESSERTCRPLAHWTGQDIFIYMAAHDLPIHPAYAMNMAGALNRERIRVGTLGGERGTGMGRAEWERMYYPEIVP